MTVRTDERLTEAKIRQVYWRLSLAADKERGRAIVASEEEVGEAVVVHIQGLNLLRGDIFLEGNLSHTAGPGTG